MCQRHPMPRGQTTFFLDYIATGKLVPENMAKIVEGCQWLFKGWLCLIGVKLLRCLDSTRIMNMMWPVFSRGSR